MNRRSLIIVFAIALLLAAGLGYMRFTAPPEGNLAGSSLGGAFSLVNQDGKAMTDKDFAGRYRLMYFGYTFCPDVCPTDVGLIARGLQAYAAHRPERGQKVAALFITVDPERDNPAAMKAFVGAFGPYVTGLTGTPAAIDAARKSYGIYARKVPTSDPANYLVDHFAVIYLFGPRGEPIAFVPHGSTAQDVTRMLETYVR